MKSLEKRVREALAEDGVLLRGGAHFQWRAGQVEMAAGVAQAITERTSLVVEAGTGVGKTLAYLIPLLLSGQRAVLSTATHLLQEQLAQRDIPAVCRALGLPVRVSVLKGRASYVCLHRLEQACQGMDGSMRDSALSADLAAIRQWARGSRSGDFSELPGWEERSALHALAGSTRENCLGQACPRVADCHFIRTRRDAATADWVILNHHLFFAEWQGYPDEAVASLGGRQVVVFDEAHRLPDVSRQSLGLSVGRRRLSAFSRDLATQGVLWAQGMRPWAFLALSLDRAVRQMDHLAPGEPAAGHRGRWSGGAPQGVDTTRWNVAVRAVDTALLSAFEALQATASAAADLRRLLARAHDLARDWRQLVREKDAGRSDEARWVNWGSGRADGSGWRLVRAPVDSPAVFQAWMDRLGSHPIGWIFTSATLGSDASLGWFTRRLGLDTRPGVRTARFPSPFDHLAQMALFVPLHLPEPWDPAHSIALADAIAGWASRLGGRTLVLTTSVRAARRISARLRGLSQRGECAMLEVLDESTASRPRLLARFRDAGAAPERAAVLVASMAFWEGVDLAGDVLQLLVIDKLPFPPPDDPVMEARARQLSRDGLDPFVHGFLPEAEQALRQGSGRLIRSANDRGVIAIGDTRLMSRDYGQRLLACLPAHRQLVDEAGMAAELDRLRLTRASTRDRWTS